MSTSLRCMDLQPSYTIDLNNEHQPESYDQLYPSLYRQRQQDGGGSYDQTALGMNKGSASRPKFRFTLFKKEEQVFGGRGGGGGGGVGGEFNGSSIKWPPLGLMTTVMRGDEDQRQQLPPLRVEAERLNLMGNALIGGSQNTSNNNDDDNTMIRVCSDCNTTKTPLWRSGPRGPKSLCNACGIRQRKARRAMAMAAAAANGSLVPNCMSAGSTIRAGNGPKKASNNNNNNNGNGTMKKRSKIVKPARLHQHNSAQRKLCFEKFALNLSEKLSLQQSFPKEEKEAAILLMALSCGLVR